MRSNANVTRRGTSAVGLLTLFLCVGSPGAAADGALPRYRMEVGQELVYQLTATEDPRERRDKDNEKRPAARNQMEWRVLVGRQNGDGSWRLFIRTKVTFVHPDGSPRGKQDSFGYCDLRPDGSYSLDEGTAVFKRLMPSELFCRLPDTEAALKDGWHYEPPAVPRMVHYRVARRDADLLQIGAVQNSDYSEVNKWQTGYVFDFDTKQGLVLGNTSEWKQLDPEQVKSRRTIRLTSNTKKDPAWVARFREEAGRYLELDAKWMALCYEGLRSHTLPACRAARASARAILVAGREQAGLDEIRELYDVNLKVHDDDEQGHTRLVKKREEFFAATPEFSTNWTARNLAGGTFRLEDHRGRVLILYFWETGCEYNVLAGPQIRQLAADYQGKDVEVVGMFLRQGRAGDEEARASQFIAKSYRGFPHVEAKEIPALYRLGQYGMGYRPSVLVLDQAGIVREAFAGYSADLGQEVRKAVEELRRKPPVRRE